MVVLIVFVCVGGGGCGVWGVKGFWQNLNFVCDADVIKTPLSSNEELLVLFSINVKKSPRR